MGQRRGLIDSNVLIAAATQDHIHNDESARLLQGAADGEFATSVHCLSEFYNGTTRPRASGGGSLSPRQALEALAAMEGALEVFALTIAEHRTALSRFASLGGTGPRIYDFLIGEVATINAIGVIVTWNTKHFLPMFPQLRVVTPTVFMESV